MKTDDLLAHVAECAQALPGASLQHPFGEAWDAWMVEGKMFALFGSAKGERLVNLKADPRGSQMLRDEYPDITPGYHMNKKHWISLHGGGELDPQLVAELVVESYLLVVESLPRARRPVDPQTFTPEWL